MSEARDPDLEAFVEAVEAAFRARRGKDHVLAPRDFALAYFENRAQRARLAGFAPGANYRWQWFDPRTGTWAGPKAVRADAQGVLQAPPFPRGGDQAAADVAAKITRTD